MDPDGSHDLNGQGGGAVAAVGWGDGVGELDLHLLMGWSCNIAHRDRRGRDWLVLGRWVKCLKVEVMIWKEKEAHLSGLP